jgi:hypothetical protein
VLQQQQGLHRQADDNLNHAVLLRAGADQLTAATAAMEELRVEDAVDQLQDAAGLVQDHSALLTTPLLPVDTVAIDDEWERLQAQQVQLPTPPRGGAAEPVRDATRRQQVKE